MLAEDDSRCRSGETRVVVGQSRGSVLRALLHRPAAPHSRWAWRCVTPAESRKPHGCEGSASWSERRGLQHALRPSRATWGTPSPLLLLPALLALLTLTPALAAPLGGVRTGRLVRAESQWEGWRHAKGGAVGHGAGVRKRLYVLPAESNAPRPHATATAAPPALAAASPAAPATNNSGASSAPTRPDSGGTGVGSGAAGAAEAAAIPDDRASLLPCPMVTSATQGGSEGNGGLGGVLSLLRVVQAGDGGGDEGEEAAGQRGSLSRVDPMDGFRRYRGPYNVTDVHYWASAAFTGWWAAAVGVILCLAGIVLVGLTLCFRRPLSWCHVATSRKGARARVAAAAAAEGATEAERVSGRGTERGQVTRGRAGRGEQLAVPCGAAAGTGIAEAMGGRLEACVQGHKPMAGSPGAHWPHVDMCTSPTAASPVAARVSAPDMGDSITRSASSSLSSFSSFSSPRTSSASSATRPSVSSSLSSSSASSSAPFLSLSTAASAPIGLRHVASELSVPWEGEECEAWGQEEKKPCQRGAEEGISNMSGSNSVATAPRGTGASREAGGVGAEGREKTRWGRAVRLGWQVVRWVLLAASLLLAMAAVGVALYASESFRPIAMHTRDTVISSIAAAINKLDHMSGTLTAAYAVFNRTLSDPSLLLPAQPPPPQVQAQQKQQMGSAWAAPESGGGASGSSGQAGNAGGAGSSSSGPCGSSSGGNGTAGGSQQGWGNAVGRVGGEGSGNDSSMDAASILVFARRALVSVHTLQRQAHELEGTVERVAQRAFSITTTTLISLMAASCLLLLLTAISALVSCSGRRQYLAVHLLSMAVLLALLLVAWLLAAVFSSARVMLRDSCAEMALYAATPAASTLAPLLPCINPRAARIARVNAARGANQLVGFANAQIESGNAALGGLSRMLRSAGLLETSAPGGGDASGADGGGTAVASSAVEGAGGAARAGGLRGRGSSMGMVSSSSVAEAGSGGGNSEAAVPDAVAHTEQSSTALNPGGSSNNSSSGGDRVIPLLCPVFNESSNLAPAVCPAGYGSVRSFEQDYAAYHCESENPVVCVRRGTPIPNSSYHLLADAAAATASVADLVPDMYDLATCQFLVDLFQDLSSSPQGCYGAKSKVQLEWVAFILFGVALTMLVLACIIALYRGGMVPVAPGSHQFNGRVTAYVILSSLVAASGGLLFGYDIGITGGVTNMDGFLEAFFPAVLSKKLSAHENSWCKFDSQLLQLFTSSLFIAGIFGGLIASVTTSRFGRVRTMLVGGIFFLLGAALTGAAVNIEMLVLGRVLLGLGVGSANQAVPLYLSEMAPAQLRGALNMMFQMATTLGIVGGQLINYGTAHLHPWGWRLSLALAAVPAAVLTAGGLFLPDTPNSLVERGHATRGRQVLQRIRGVEVDVQEEFDEIQRACNASKTVKAPFFAIFRRKYRPELTWAILIPVFQQLTGINAIMFYVTPLFQSLGFGDSASLLTTVITGAVNVVATLVSILTVDRFGRKSLFLVGGVQMVLAQVAIGVLLGTTYASGTGSLSSGYATAVVVVICVYVAGFAWSWGPLGWLVPSEIQPLETRSAGQSITVAVNFIFTFAVGQAFLSMLCHFKFGIFLFFAAWVVVMTVCVMLFLPETKGVPIEEMAGVWQRHWFWKRVVPGAAQQGAAVKAEKGDKNQAVSASSNGAMEKAVVSGV
ncbi:unnamed protein product [Closterium sp. NIES-53]